MSAILLAALLTAAQPAVWTQDDREPVCVYDGLLAAARAGALDQPRINATRDECRQRFGWTEDQARHGVAVAVASFRMVAADGEARNAGVDPSVIDAVTESFGTADAATLISPGGAVTEQGRATIALVVRRVRERGLTGEQATKATEAVLSRMQARNIIAAFSAEVMPAPSP